MICDVVIPVWNKRDLTDRCVKSVLNNTLFPHRIVLIDNGSEKFTGDYLKKLSLENPDRIKLIVNSKNLGNTAAGVQGMKYSDAEYVCILDNDTIVCKGWLSEMVKVAELSDRIGILNPNCNSFGLHKPKNLTLEDFSKELLSKNAGKYIEIGAAVGFCYMVKRKVINEIGYWDERFSPGYFEDTEYSMRAKKYGYKSVIASGAYIYHDEHSSFKSKEKKRYFEKLFAQSREKFYALYGKPKRILYIIDKPVNDIEALNRKIYEAADKGDFVDVVLKKRIADMKLPRHGNVKKIIYGDLLFRAKVRLKIITKKKKYDIVLMGENE